MSNRTLQILVIAGAFALLSMTATKSFATPPPHFLYGVMTTGSNAGGYSDPTVGQTITGSAATNDTNVAFVKFVWHYPNGTAYQTDIVNTHTASGGSSCLTDATKYTGSVSHDNVANTGTGFNCWADDFTIPDSLGDWGMQAFFCSEDQTCTGSDKVAIRAISFNVLPESAIGTVALVGASAAALGGFFVLQSRSKRSLPSPI